MERLVTRIGTGEAVPLKIDLDFVFDLDKRTFDGLKEIFSQLCTLTDILGDDYDLDELKDIKKRAEYADNTEKRANRYKTMVLDLLGDDCDLDRLRELVEADRDGRCVVLPSGGYADKDGENALKSAMNTCFYHNNPVTRYIADAIAEKLTREAAEDALKGDQNGKA